MKILGLDYGDARIGVALGDEEHGLATPLTIIQNNNLEQILYDLKRLLEIEHAGLIVVGWPLGLSGQATEQTHKTRKFIEQLRERLQVPVETMDERFTTQAAAALSALAGREHDDAEAAAAMLQMYLDLHERPL